MNLRHTSNYRLLSCFTCVLTTCFLFSGNQNFALGKTKDLSLFAAVKHESDNAWQQIHWCMNTTQALNQAKLENKPIFVFFMVDDPGAHGKT